jgi:hypothetical protein
MAFKPSVAVFDACILYPFHLRNIIVQAAVDRLVDARWTDAIHEEWIMNLAANAPTLPLERLYAVRRLMNDALPDANVSRYEDLIPTVHIPDPDDRHVVAAAISAGSSLILTWNLRDFPETELTTHGLRSQTPDAFLAELYDQVPDLTVGSLANARRNLNRSGVSVKEFIDVLNTQNLTQLAMRVTKHPSNL